MKIWCDVCDKQEASVFCSADEAALCEDCDRCVHHANKLATKHTRFSLLQPTCNQFPLCDICQERRAFLFCQEDRAIFCRECDVPIHKANEHTHKHNRFLLTGVKLSASSSLYPTSSSPTSSDSKTPKRPRTDCEEISSSPWDKNPISSNSDDCSYSASSISEYLMETLPGWQVEDFFDASFASNGFSKVSTIINKR
ncbi:hypothetical protein UlMin_032846 [Ulmus minor]